MRNPIPHVACGGSHWTEREVMFCNSYGPPTERFRPQVRLATERQLRYIENLGGDLAHAAKLTVPEASAYIDRLKLQSARVSNTRANLLTVPPREQRYPFSTPRPMVENMKEGRYAVRKDDNTPYTFLRVSRPKHGKKKGCLVIQSQHSDWYRDEFIIRSNGTLWLRPGGNYIDQSLLHVAVDPVSAAINYGRELGCCSRCGRELTDERSRWYSIGPECEKHWPELINYVNETRGVFGAPCNCWSPYEDKKGKVIHYVECAFIQERLNG